MMTIRTLALGSVLILCCVAPGTVPEAPNAIPQAARALRLGEELIEWLARSDHVADRADSANELANAIRQVMKAGEDISPQVAEVIRRDFGMGILKVTSTVDAPLLRLLSKNPDICEPALRLVTRPGLRLRDWAPRIEKLSRELGDRAPSVLRALGTSISGDDAVLFMRGIAGRALSRKNINKVADALENSGLNSREMGEAWECISRAQLSKGANKATSGLREGGEVVSGQYNKVHGIDGVGAAEDGRPVIFEFSMYRQKALGETADGVQLSPSWTAKRWNLAMDDPTLVAEFRRVGVDQKYLQKMDVNVTATWPRKLVVVHDSALTDANRMAAGLGPQDLFVLGGN